MSDLYSARDTTIHAKDLSLDDALARVEPWGVSLHGARKVLEQHEGPYAEVSFIVRTDHPDADALDRLTPGFLHLLLIDLLPGLEARAPEGLAREYQHGRRRACQGCEVVFAVTESTPKQATLRVVCAASDVYDGDGFLVSTAWGPDRLRRAAEPFEVVLDRYPAPGIAGAFSTKSGGITRTASGRGVFAYVRKLMEVGGVTTLGATAYAVSRDGGHVAKLGKAQSVKVGKPRPGDKKRVATNLHALGKALWIEWEDGSWTSVDPKTGARQDGQPPPRPSEVSREVVIGGSTHQAEATPDPNTWLVAGENACLWHEPTGQVTLSLGLVHGYAWTSGNKPKLWTYGARTVCSLAFDLS